MTTKLISLVLDGLGFPHHYDNQSQGRCTLAKYRISVIFYDLITSRQSSYCANFISIIKNRVRELRFPLVRKGTYIVYYLL